MPTLQDFKLEPLLSNSLLDWALAAATVAGVLAVFLTVRALVRRYQRRFQATPRNEWLEIPLDVLGRTMLLPFVVVALYAGLQLLAHGPALQRVAGTAVMIVLFWQAGVWASAAASAWIERRRRKALVVDRAMAGSLGIIRFVANLLIWSFVLLMILDNVGVDVTALIAGLGIGGIAVALAAQNLLSDLFASLSITLDRPFVVGDFLIIDEFLGSVEYIGIKSTRLRSLSGEQIVMSNADLLGSRVRNYGRMSERRVVFRTRAPYGTPPDIVERVPAIIREAIESLDRTRFDRSHFHRYDDGALDFETVYYVLSPDYNVYMDIQQAINLQVYRAFRKLGIEFAYPTQRILLDQPGVPVPAAAVSD